MDMRLELVPVPVSDVDRAKAFYVDLDHQITDELRVVQLTPPGSACSIMLGTGVVHTKPGSIENLHLVVADIHTARSQLVERGVEVTEGACAGSQPEAMVVTETSLRSLWSGADLSGADHYRLKFCSATTIASRVHGRATGNPS